MESGTPGNTKRETFESLAGALDALAEVQDAVYIKDREGRYLMVNAHGAAVTGRTPTEMMGLTDSDVFGAPGEAMLRADLELMREGRAQTVEEEPVVVDGEMLTFLKTKAPLRDVSGTVIGLVAVSTDISERKRLEEELRTRGALLAQAQAIARVGSWEWDVARDEMTWSPEFYEMIGVDPSDVEPTYEGFIERIHPDDRPAAEGALQRALASEDSCAVAHRLVRADGEERMMLCRGEVHRDVDGSPLRIVGAALDLSEYLGVANDMRMRHEHLLAAEEVAGTGSFQWGVEADEVTWSDGMYRVFGLRDGDFDGTFKGYLERVHPDDREAQRGGLEALMRDGESRTAEYRIVRGDSSVGWIRSQVAVVRARDGAPRRLIGVLRDITDERTS